MATRYQNTYNPPGRVPSYYANNNLYPYANARNDYQTRVSRRRHEGLSIDLNYGLDTTSDDVNSSPYSSPYYINGRYNSSNLTTQTGNSASVQGTKLLLVLPETETVVENTGSPETYMKLWQGKQVRFELPYTGKIVGTTISLRNTGASRGILSIYLSATPDGPVLAETSIDLCTVSQDNFEHKKLYTMTPVPLAANPKGIIYVRMEIWDEVSCERSTTPFDVNTYIEVYATGAGYHGECENAFGDKNQPVRDTYEYTRKPNRPELGLVYNDWECVPTNRIEGVDYGATVSYEGYRYDIFTIKNLTTAKLVIYDRQANTIVPTDIIVDARTTGVNLVQPNEWVYFVDGYSPLRKFKVNEWIPQEVTSNNSPVVGASIITFHNNRTYLSGFRYDPNLVQCTEITESGPAYDSFPYRFYSPGESPAKTSDNPITAIMEYENDTLMVATTGGFQLYQSNENIEDGIPSQIGIHSDGGGVAAAGDITNFRGIIYSFDPDEGIRRFTGSMWNKIPAALDSHIERVDMTKPRKLWGYAYKLYFNYTDVIDGRAKCIVWDMAMNYQQYPWFQDIDVPFCDCRTSNDFEIVGIHPEFPCIMELYSYDTWRRLDTPIVFRRDSKYLSLPGGADELVLKRVFLKVMANSTRWWWVGLSFDKDNMYPDRGVQAWYRLPSWSTTINNLPVEDPFSTEDIYEQYATSLLALPNLNAQVLSVQVRVQAKTFRSQANYVSLQLQGQARPYN